MRVEIPWSVKKFYLKNLNFPNRIRSMESIFGQIYANNAWRGNESVSGPGSSLEYTAQLRGELPRFFNRYGISSILDAPCGDFSWMQRVDLSGIDRYHGVDVVPALIDTNQSKFSDEIITFSQRDITQDELPEVDLVICRDCFFHFSHADTFKVLRNFQASGSKFILVTTHIDHPQNKNIITGGFSLVNLEKPPFNFPKALEYLPDRGNYPPGHKQYQRHLALWKLEGIQI